VDGWSLGNELIGNGLDPAQYARDYQTFAAALKKYPSIGQSIYGPSGFGFLGTSVPTFLSGAGSLLSGLTYHTYPLNDCSLDVYVVKSRVEGMIHDLVSYARMRDSIAPKLPLILEETATQAGGGCEGLSDRFVSGFWWVHALGMAAETGTSRVHRQDVAGFSFNHRASHYMLAGVAGWVNSSSNGPLTPHPDWYATVLHKQLAGNAVLASRLTSSSAVNQSVAVHVWCAAAASKAPSGAVTLSYVNMGATDVQLTVPTGTSSPRVEYMMQPGQSGREELGHPNAGAPPTSLTSDTVLLNGNKLSVGKDGALPVYPIPGKRVTDGADIVLPAWSYGFVVLEAAAASACKN